MQSSTLKGIKGFTVEAEHELHWRRETHFALIFRKQTDEVTPDKKPCLFINL